MTLGSLFLEGPCCLESIPFLTFRTRQPNLQPIRVVPAWVSFGITNYLGLCGPTGRQSSMDIDMTRVTRRGPRIPIVLASLRDPTYIGSNSITQKSCKDKSTINNYLQGQVPKSKHAEFE
uniref:Uncharacterized protein n=1 Tax=Cucumis melo TaxID=3656 RepID=A0A9I9E9S5_CUCME